MIGENVPRRFETEDGVKYKESQAEVKKRLPY